MTEKSFLLTVSLYLRGDNLDPVHVSAQLCVTPTDSQYKGEKVFTSTNHEVIKKLGVWSLTTTTNSHIISDHLYELDSKIEVDSKSISNISGVEEAYVDVFMAMNRNREGSDTSMFELNSNDIKVLNRFGFPVRFTITFIDE